MAKKLKKDLKDLRRSRREGTDYRDYNLIKDIRGNKLYKSNVVRRDKVSRNELEELPLLKKGLIPGQLMMFNYFTPIHKEELEYYDAMPVTLFFGIFKTERGKRVLGFNIHYYPPKIRYQVMNRIYEIFKSHYKDIKNPISSAVSGLQYDMLLKQLKQAKLDFGVRMYDPGLMNNVRPIPVNKWPLAVFTEGVFKKRTREAILNYWRTYK